MSSPITLEQKQRAYSELSTIKADFAGRGWFPATSGNLSIRVGEIVDQKFTFAVTASGKDKSQSTPEDFLLVNELSLPTEATNLKPSAETKIHSEIYRLTGCGAIFHIHTVYNNLLSELCWEQGSIPIEGVELIKAFNIWEEDASIEIPILPNYADIAKIASGIEAALIPRIPGIVLRKHGIYAWGADAFEAKRHLEAFEYLFEYSYKLNLIQRASTRRR
ncbi:methylthioribulose 1-phosphate dehydratase [Paenibacillus psychroresistens]|uniref:Methylthioribulose-1-phosphate dehydratase n=1 Tax=Paenibacillus psychroresistens TaxID=1778678 RepID=A0A6B8RLV7_9BACL|nr:methylthioribulose 1-phosphate dehydratase [Paenibacillus psychroresistens]QGQ96827.1 methylthioribulose 1-phosphate dehydratase [Paenibacillus psychroresistens]